MNCVEAPAKLDISPLVAGRPYLPFIVADVGLLPLSKEQWAIVDAADFERASALKWSACQKVSKNFVTFYAYRQTGPAKKRTNVMLHDFILPPGPGLVVDHYNGHSLDNRRRNLRACTQGQNNCNKRVVVGASQYIGVSWASDRQKWMAQVAKDGVVVTVGRFENEVEAAIARDHVAQQMHGEFARLNFPEAALPLRKTGTHG